MPRTHCVWLGAVLSAVIVASVAGAADELGIRDSGHLPPDARLKPLRTLNDAYHPWTPPKTLPEWETETASIRARMLVGLGLWPMPPAALLRPTIHGKIDRDDYTVEKVFFPSHRGFYVTGNLYRPKNVAGQTPGVLCPHGHWQNGRFYELSAADAQRLQIDKGAEKFLCGAQYPLQARCVGLARMGCTVFHYDMVGYADSQQIPHRQGFTDADAALRLQDFMGLQTFNSICALNFLTSLPEVDPERIGVTGASGGGTQTFMLCGIDNRPAAAFPAVMVSTAMQGGCVCENCSYLRIGTNNIALAALFAPKPLAMSGANDWTVDIETKGLPDLKRIYGLYGAPDQVQAKAFPQFPHNYNQVAREMMYGWFNKHLKLNLPEPIEEREFQPLAPKDLSVFDADHPLPADAVNAAQLRQHLTRVADEQFARLLPREKSQLASYQGVVGIAARVMFDGAAPGPDDVLGASIPIQNSFDGGRMQRISVSRRGADERIPVVQLMPDKPNGTVVLWFDGAGKQHLFGPDGKPTAQVMKLLQKGASVVSADLFMTGDFLPDGLTLPDRQPVDPNFAGFTFGYNRPLVANRVRDILTVLASIRRHHGLRAVHLVGTGAAGPWALLARAMAGDTIDRCYIDLQGFGFSKITSTSDPMMLPGGLKYGGIGGLAALAAPGDLHVYGVLNAPREELAPLEKVYKVAGGNVELIDTPLAPEDVAAALGK